MKRQIYFLIICMLSPFYISTSSKDHKDSKIELVSIECPQEVIISKKMDIKDKTVKYTVNYKYMGNNIIAGGKGNTSYYGYRDVVLLGQIYYVDKNNRISPGAMKHFKGFGLSGGIEGLEIFSGGGILSSGKPTIFENGKIYSKDFFIFVPSYFEEDPFFKDMDIYERINNKSLSTVLLIIEKIRVIWEIEYKNKEIKIKKKNGNMECDANIVQIIHIKYD